MAGKADLLREHESVRGVVGRLLTAMEVSPAGGSEASDRPSRPKKSAVPAAFLFTSPRNGQGTSTIAAAVASALAGTGRRTVLVLVGPTSGEPVSDDAIPLHEAVGTSGAIDFAEPPLLTLQAPVLYTDFPAAACNPPETWLPHSDVVIIDAPTLADGLSRHWAPGVRGVVLVVDGERVSVRSVVEAREDLARLGARLLGVVMNRHRSRIPRFVEPHLG